MISRREFMQVAAATAAMAGTGAGLTRAFAEQRLTEKELLAFEPLGNVTLVHVTDIHGQFDAAVFPRAVDQSRRRRSEGFPPHITGKDFLASFGIARGSSAAYALTSEDFEALAKTYGKIGGLDRTATVIKAIRAERGDKVAAARWWRYLAGVVVVAADARAGHGRLHGLAQAGRHDRPLGIHLRHRARQRDRSTSCGFPFLGSNIRDTEWNDPAFEAYDHVRARRRQDRRDRRRPFPTRRSPIRAG